MPSSQEIARVMAEMDRFNQTAKMTVTEERYEKRVASVGGSYGGLTALLQQGAPGNWASDHKSEAEKFAGWHYVAISSIGKAVRSANCEAYQEKVREYAKAYNEQDDDSEPLQKWHPLMKLLKRPNPSQSGASFREEVAIQLCLTGSALIWNVPNQMGRTVERYVIPTAIAEPRQPEKGRPRGGWYINPEVARWQIESGWFLYTGLATAIGKVIDARDVQVIRFIHPVFKDEGQSPVSAGALWTDTSEKVDISRHSHLRNGSDPSVIIGIDGVEDEGTLQRMSAKFNEKYAGPSKHGKAMFVNGQNVKVEPVTRTPAEMAYEGAFVQFRDAIMALHGVTPIAAGIEAPSGDDGLYAPLKQFISGTVQPILDLMAEEDTEQLAGQFGEGISVLYTAKAVDDAKLTEQQINTDIAAGAIEVDEIRKLRGRKPWGGEKGKAVAGQGAKEEPKPGLPGLAQGVPGLEPQTGSQALDPSKPPQGTPDPMKLAEEAVAKALGGFADRLSALLKSGDNCGTGAGGFQEGNTCGQRRAKKGGQVGMNGEFYAGGQFLPSTDMPKKVRADMERIASGKSKVDEGLYEKLSPGEFAPYEMIGTFLEKAGRDGEGRLQVRASNDTALAYMGVDTQEKMGQLQSIINRFNAGERKLQIFDYPSFPSAKDIIRALNANLPIPESMLPRLQGNLAKFVTRNGEATAKAKTGDNCGTGAGGFQPGNDCAGGRDGGEGGEKPAKKKRGKKVAEESSGPKIEVFERGAGELEFTSRGDLIRGKLGDLPITEGEPGLIGKLSKKTKAGVEAAMTDPDLIEDLKAGGIEALNVEATNYYQKKTGRKGGWTAAYSNGALSINPKTIETIEASTIQERKDGGLKRVISHEAGHGVWDTARDADKKAFAEALKKNPEIVSYVSSVVNVKADPNAFSNTGSRVVTESFAEIHALRRYNREMYDSLPEDIRNPVESARKFGLELSERKTKWADRLKPKWQKSGSDCGANAEGGGGFQPGNTCGRGDGSGESGGEDDYRGSHRAPGRDGGAPLDDMTGGGEIYPDDIYSDKAARYYGTGEPAMDRKSIKIIQSLRGKPDAEVTIYRAVPADVKGKINPGDWVTINRDYAVYHGEGPLRGDYRIMELKVRAGDVYSSGDSIHEYGYDPAPKKKSLGKSGSDCGANAQGGGGFQPGNTCGKRDGKGGESSEGGGKGASVNPKILAWAREKFGDDTTAENFAKWFGDSKVVDEEGNPLVVYHGTGSDFDTFNTDRKPSEGNTTDPNAFIGAHFTASTETANRFAEELYGVKGNAQVKPVFLALDNPLMIGAGYPPKDELAKLEASYESAKAALENYTRERNSDDSGKARLEAAIMSGDDSAIDAALADPVGDELYKKRSEILSQIYQLKENNRPVKESEIYEVAGMSYDDVANRLNSLKGKERAKYAARIGRQLKDKLSAKGYDGVFYENAYEEETGLGAGAANRRAFIAFRSTQIKSATGNSGTFDPKDPNITKSGSGCGANAQGGGGFQPGNTCGKRDGKGGESSEGGGKGASVNPKILAWAREKFGDDTTAENFAKWFGDSKVVDEEGNPLVVYRGDRNEINDFSDTGKRREVGIFTTPDKSVADIYGNGKSKPLYVSAERFLDLTIESREVEDFVNEWGRGSFDEWVDRETGERVEPIEVLRSGRMFEYEGDWSAERWLDLQATVKAAGYQAVKLPDYGNDGPFESIVVFSPTQIKSATGNSGTFDPKDPNITKSGSGCGANAEGGGGFQPGNTCGSREGGDSEGSGGSKPGKGGKVYEWALKKFKDEETARNFTKWFGDSKVVDGDGNPLTVYHGTTGDFAEFDPRASIKSGQEFGAGIYLTTDAERAALYANDEGGSIKPLYLKAESVLDRDGELSEAQAESISRVLSEDILPEDLSYHTSTRAKRTFKDKDEARTFYQQQKQEWDQSGEGVARYKPSVSRSTLGIDDEFVVEYSDKEKVSIMRGGRDAVSQLMRTYGNDYTFALSRAGVDAVKVGDIYVVTSPNQIKSATGNSGKFDPSSNDITKSSDCGANGPGGGGFQPGNTCGREDGAGEAQGEAGKPNPKVLEWARKKFGSDEVAENFARWFGDSKMVDKDGNPLTVYHGTNAEFTEFDENRQGATDDGYLGTGFYFAPGKEWASGYGDNVIDAHLSIQNPITIPWSSSWGHESIYDVRDALAELPDMPDGIKTVREIPDGYKLYEQELEDGNWGYNPNGNNKRYYVGPSEELYGTDKEIFGKKTSSPLSAIVQFNDELKGVGFDDVDAAGLFRDIGRDKIKASLIKSGRDGIITFDPDTKELGEVLVFKSKQIKSASKNSGKFSPDSGDITKAAPNPKQSRKKSARKPAKGGTMRRKKGS